MHATIAQADTHWEFDEKEAGYADTDWQPLMDYLGIHTGSPQKKAIHDFLKRSMSLFATSFNILWVLVVLVKNMV